MVFSIYYCKLMLLVSLTLILSILFRKSSNTIHEDTLGESSQSKRLSELKRLRNEYNDREYFLMFLCLINVYVSCV